MSIRRRSVVWLFSGVLAHSAVSVAPAAADPDPGVTTNIEQARGSAGCPALRYDQNVERAAAVINRSSFDYVNHTAEDTPADGQDLSAIVNEFGVGASKAMTLQGAGQDSATALRGLLLQGYQAIPDCSYTDFGVDSLVEPVTGFHLIVVVLAER